MDLQTQKKLNTYFELQKVMDAQIFRESLIKNTKRQHQLALSLRDGAKNTKIKEGILTGVEIVANKLLVSKTVEQER